MTCRDGKPGILHCDGTSETHHSFPARVNVPLRAGGGGDRLFAKTVFTQIHTLVDNVIEECGLSPGLLRGVKAKTNTVLKIQ